MHQDKLWTEITADPRWLRPLRCGSAAARLLGLVGSNTAGGMDVCCESCVLSGRGL